MELHSVLVTGRSNSTFPSFPSPQHETNMAVSYEPRRSKMQGNDLFYGYLFVTPLRFRQESLASYPYVMAQELQLTMQTSRFCDRRGLVCFRHGEHPFFYG